MQNLIIAAAAGYTISDLANFIHSAKRYCEAVIAVLAQDLNQETREWLKRNGVIIFEHKLKSIPIYLSRNYGYKNVLLSLKEYSTIFLTDIRDVVFQKNVFENIDSDDLFLFEETYSTRLHECPYNSSWVLNLYGEKIFALLKNRTILCAGTTLGGRRAMEIYLEEMLEQIESAISKKVSLVGLDQGIHNYLIYSNMLPEKLIDNGTNFRLMRNGDIVLTAGRVHEFRFDKNQMLVNEDNSIPAVIHQYDRHELLKNLFNGKFQHEYA